LLLEALRAHNAGNFDTADEVYSQILRAQPRVYVRAIVLLHRGIARMAAGRYDAARSDIDDALQLDPENWRGYFYRGTIHRVKGSVTEAEQDFSRCLDLDPYQVECLFQRALLYVDTGRPRQALSDAARAVELAPENAAVMQLLEKLRSNNE
jgi:tetratricopeptide (TPR) repeat protein